MLIDSRGGYCEISVEHVGGVRGDRGGAAPDRRRFRVEHGGMGGRGRSPALRFGGGAPFGALDGAGAEKISPVQYPGRGIYGENSGRTGHGSATWSRKFRGDPLSSRWSALTTTPNTCRRPPRSSPGRMDGGSGVAALLAMIRAIDRMKEPPPLGIRFVFFDGEECRVRYGCGDGLHGAAARRSCWRRPEGSATAAR